MACHLRELGDLGLVMDFGALARPLKSSLVWGFWEDLMVYLHGFFIREVPIVSGGLGFVVQEGVYKGINQIGFKGTHCEI